MTAQATRIGGLKNLTTGEVADAHRIGSDDRGRGLICFVEGWQPQSSDGREIYPEQDVDGNWIEGTECEPYTFE